MNQKIKVSLILIVNKKNVYNEFLKNVNSQKNIVYELIPINNYHNEYTSARQAYNSAAKDAKGEYLMFLHPDIRFLDKMSLCDILNQVDRLTDFGVAGIAGAKKSAKKKRDIYSNIFHGSEKKRVGIEINQPVPVQTLDECLFIIKNKYFQRNPFSHRDGWHLYSVEYCLDALRNGRVNYVIPSRVWHLSDGKSLDANYVFQLNEIIKKERSSFDLICTTVKAWPTKGINSFLYRKYFKFKQYIKQLLCK